MTRDDIISMAREAGFSQYQLGGMFDVYLEQFAAAAYAAGQAAERETRKAAQLETIALRQELTNRAMQAEKEAYQRGVRDEREMCAKIAESTVCDTHIPTGVKIYGRRAAQEIRNRKEEE